MSRHVTTVAGCPWCGACPEVRRLGSRSHPRMTLVACRSSKERCPVQASVTGSMRGVAIRRWNARVAPSTVQFYALKL